MNSKVLVRAILMITALIIGVSSVNAEHEWDHRYTISGKVTAPDGGGVLWMPVEIDCSEENGSDPSLCGHNVDREGSTSIFGFYEVILHIHTTDNGKLVVLNLDGQRIEHVLDLTGPDGEPEEGDRYVTLNLVMDHDPGFGNSTSFLLMALIIAITSIALLVKQYRNKVSNTIGIKVSRSQLVSKLECPECGAGVKARNLANHLSRVHDIQAKEASAIVESLR